MHHVAVEVLGHGGRAALGQADVPEARGYLEAGHIRGQVVITV